MQTVPNPQNHSKGLSLDEQAEARTRYDRRSVVSVEIDKRDAADLRGAAWVEHWDREIAARKSGAASRIRVARRRPAFG